MARSIVTLASLLTMVIGGWFGLAWWEKNSAESQYRDQMRQAVADERRQKEIVQAQLADEQKRSEMLRKLVGKLTSSRRVAQLVVAGQEQVDGRLMTKFYFHELGRDGKTMLSPKVISVEGTGVHVDGYVIQFPDDFVAKDDPKRGHSIILFHRIFGHQSGVDGAHTLDSPGQTPDFYKNVDPELAEYEQTLWKDFWRLAEDAAYREKLNVKLAYGGSVYTDQLKPGQVYDLTLDPQGGLKMVLRLPGQ